MSSLSPISANARQQMYSDWPVIVEMFVIYFLRLSMDLVTFQAAVCPGTGGLSFGGLSFGIGKFVKELGDVEE